MAKKTSAINIFSVIVALYILGLAVKNWVLFVALGAFGFVTWLIIEAVKNRKNSSPFQAHQGSLGERSTIDPVIQSSKNAFVGQLPKLKNTTNHANDNAQKAANPDSLWISFSDKVKHAGYTISSGLIYVGNGLSSIRGLSEEPALIDITLPVDTANPNYDGQNLGYWPSYSKINPSSRAAYLEWLATDKKNPATNIGYVFIYFYGLERRALADVKKSVSAQNDIPDIIAEVKRLLSIYGENGSFHRYASRFLDVLQSFQMQVPLYQTAPQLELRSWDVPLTLKVSLGQMAADRVPLTTEWALAWAVNDPSMPRRTPTQRCVQEFHDLFRIKYHDKFGTGLILEPNNEKLQSIYFPASSSFGGQVVIPYRGLTDLTGFSGPSVQIRELVSACIDELEGYSRFLGRNPKSEGTIEAISYLPQSLINKQEGGELPKLKKWLDEKIFSDATTSVHLPELLLHMPSIKQDVLGKKEMTVIANFLGKMNIGIEPDPRFGNFIPNPVNDVVLFRIGENAPNSPSAEYYASTIVLHLASAVAGANGSIDTHEKSHLLKHLESSPHLTSDEQMRLRAHTLFLFSSLPSMNGIKKRIELLKQEQRESLGKFLVDVAQADGYIDLSEMKILTKIYVMLDLDPKSLYSHAHAAALEPVSVQFADLTAQQGYAIPTPPEKSEGVALDMGIIKAKLAETVAVSTILNNIFSEENLIQKSDLISKSITSNVSIAGLDEESFAFMKELTRKLIWSRVELEKLATDHCLMLDGTLDSINDASFDHFGGPFFEGDETIEINAEFAKEIKL